MERMNGERDESIFVEKNSHLKVEDIKMRAIGEIRRRGQ